MKKYASLRRDWKIIYSGDIVEVFEYRIPINVEARDYEIVKGTKKEEGKRQDNLNRARGNIRRYVWNNITEYSKFITLTYSDTCLDQDKVIKDFKQFIQNLKRKGYNELKWLYITEHQKNRGLKENNAGSLHIHTILFTDEFIPYDVINKCWKHGSTDIHKIDKVNNAGAYVCKYLTKDEFNLYEKNSYHVSRGLKKSIIQVHDGYFSQGTPDELLKFLDVEFYHAHVINYKYDTEDTVFKNSIFYRQGRIRKSD